MTIYIINNILIMLWAAMFCLYKPSKKKNLIFIVLSFAQLIFLAVMRTRIGNDYDMYAGGFYQMEMQGFSQMNYKDWEIGFVFLTKILTAVMPNHLFYMGFLSILCVLPVGVYIYKYSKMPWLSVLMYVNMFIFFMQMNFVRQAIAIIFVMWAWHFMKENKFIPFAILIVIASLFHQTVLMLLIVYFWVKMKPGFKALLAYGYLILCFYIASGGLFNLITQFFHEEYNNSVFITTGVSVMYTILPVAVAILGFVLYQVRTIPQTLENKYMVNLGLLNAFIMITMSRHAILERLSYFTLIFVILLIPVIVASLKENGIEVRWGENKGIILTSHKQKMLLAIAVGGFIVVLSWLVFIYGMMHSAHGVIPYHSMWSVLNIS